MGKQFYHSNSINYDSYLIYLDELKKGDLRLLKTDLPLILPKGVHIKLLITSDDVIHSFAIPSFGIKVDAVPGRIHQVSIFLKNTETVYGQCSELCGSNHAFMPIEIVILSPKDYFHYLFFK
jgi:heme/copper-type cytochrome/quinol oxidase subunit 2